MWRGPCDQQAVSHTADKTQSSSHHPPPAGGALWEEGREGGREGGMNGKRKGGGRGEEGGIKRKGNEKEERERELVMQTQSPR